MENTTGNKKILWNERKKLSIGLPWTFTWYTLTEDTLNVKTGLLFQRFEEIKLYRIRDFSVIRTPIQRIFGLGTIHICSADSTTPEYDIINVYKPMEVKDMISNQVEKCKANYGVTELMGSYGGLHQ